MPILRLLLANERTIRTRPDLGGIYYDAALAWVNRQGTDEVAAPEEFLPAAEEGDDATVASALRNPLVDPNMTGHYYDYGTTALIRAAYENHTSVVKVLLADKRVDLNIADRNGETALNWAADHGNTVLLELLLADHRTTRTRPADENAKAQANYDAALLSVKRRRNARFRGLTRLMVVLRRMRLRAALAVYAPGGAGFVAAAASFNSAATATATATGGGDWSS